MKRPQPIANLETALIAAILCSWIVAAPSGGGHPGADPASPNGNLVDPKQAWFAVGNSRADAAVQGAIEAFDACAPGYGLQLRRAASILRAKGEREESAILLDLAVSHPESTDELISALGQRGRVRKMEGRRELARRDFEDVARYAEADRNSRAAAIAVVSGSLNSLQAIYHELGLSREALQTNNLILEIAERHGLVDAVKNEKVNRATLLDKTGDRPGALQVWDQLLADESFQQPVAERVQLLIAAAQASDPTRSTDAYIERLREGWSDPKIRESDSVMRIGALLADALKKAKRGREWMDVLEESYRLQQKKEGAWREKAISQGASREVLDVDMLDRKRSLLSELSYADQFGLPELAIEALSELERDLGVSEAARYSARNSRLRIAATMNVGPAPK